MDGLRLRVTHIDTNGYTILRECRHGVTKRGELQARTGEESRRAMTREGKHREGGNCHKSLDSFVENNNSQWRRFPKLKSDIKS